MAIRQKCVSCDKMVAKLKNGVEWVMYSAHRALDYNDTVDSMVPAICDACFDAGEGNIRFKDAKHYNDEGTWIGPKHRMIESVEDDINTLRCELRDKKQELVEAKNK